MAAGSLAMGGAAFRSVTSGTVGSPAVRPTLWTGTPEIYFAKAIDNSRLVKVEDPRRNREMKQFGAALAFLFLLVFAYAWQHFKAIEYGYQIESAKQELSGLTEMNRALHLEYASLRDPERIDVMARRMGLVPPEPGQVIRMDGTAGESDAPVVANAAPVIVMAKQ
jgi:cell division protein FtsL